MNSKSAFDYAVFIGRFQPFHIGHLFVFREALKSANHLIVLIGSANEARSLRNPFTFSERKSMIEDSLPDEMKEKVSLIPLPDFLYDDQGWVDKVTYLVGREVGDGNSSIALVGHNKDETTYYLNLFPNWHYIEVGNLDGINATPIRKQYFGKDISHIMDSDLLLDGTKKWLYNFSKTTIFAELYEEYQSVEKFKSLWNNVPYPVIFTTTDALVRYHNEILLITRKNYPGKDLFALPGGFLDKEESLFDGCLRELAEETTLNVDTQTLKNSFVKQQVFDEPKRSSRGRVVTHCYYFDLSGLSEKPSVQAADDAKSVFWYCIDELQQNTFFEDHFFIIQYFLGNYSKPVK